jgi:hypothetical protein
LFSDELNSGALVLHAVTMLLQRERRLKNGRKRAEQTEQKTIIIRQLLQQKL